MRAIPKTDNILLVKKGRDKMVSKLDPTGSVLEKTLDVGPHGRWIVRPMSLERCRMRNGKINIKSHITWGGKCEVSYMCGYLTS